MGVLIPNLLHELYRNERAMEDTRKDWKSQVPRKFSHGQDHPIARTVGELKALLAELPDDLPLMLEDSEEGLEAVVYNVGSDDAFFGLREPY